MKKFICIVILLGLSCVTTDEITPQYYRNKLSDGRDITITKEDILSESRGIITDITWHQSASVRFSFVIDQKDVQWKGRKMEIPKALYSYNDSLLLVYSTAQLIQNDSLFTKDRYKIITKYQKHIDDRFFFRLFGEQYWVEESYTTFQRFQKSGSKTTLSFSEKEFYNRRYK